MAAVLNAKIDRRTDLFTRSANVKLALPLFGITSLFYFEHTVLAPFLTKY